jgi:hypothetical protein
MGMGGQHHSLVTLPPGKTRYPFYRRVGGPWGRSGGARKISPPPGFDPPDRRARSESPYRLSYPDPRNTIYNTRLMSYIFHAATLHAQNYTHAQNYNTCTKLHYMHTTTHMHKTTLHAQNLTATCCTQFLYVNYRCDMFRPQFVAIFRQLHTSKKSRPP